MELFIAMLAVERPYGLLNDLRANYLHRYKGCDLKCADYQEVKR
jgi:hypothetical protein